MTSVVETLHSTAGISPDSTEGFRIHKTALIIYAGLRSTFSEKDQECNLGTLNLLYETLITLNEKVDISDSLEQRINSQGIPQSKFVPATLLINGIRNDLRERINTFLNNCPGAGELIEATVNDAELLSRERRKFALERNSEGPTVEDYLNIDSAISELSFIQTMYPEVLKEAGIDFSLKAKTIEDLMEKYKIFLLGRHNKKSLEGLNSTQTKIVALHAAEMVLKIADDNQDPGIDKILGVPTFDNCNGCLSPEKIRERYLSIVQSCGINENIPRLAMPIQNFARICAVHEAYKQKPTDDLWQIPEYFGNGYTLVLRHSLYAKGLLDELFRDWPNPSNIFSY